MRNKLLKTVTFLWLLALWQPAQTQHWEKIFEVNSWTYSSRFYPFFHDADTGWIVHYRDLYYTTNSGQTFEHVFSYPDSLLTNYGGGDMMWDYFYDVYPISGTVAYMYVETSGYNRILKTTDGGYNWVEWAPIYGYWSPKEMLYLTENRAVCFLYSYPNNTNNLGYSDDGGKTWIVTHSMPYQYLNTLVSNKFDGSVWGFETGLSNIYYSQDSGLTWNQKQNILGIDGTINFVTFADSETAIIYLDGNPPERIRHIFITTGPFDSIRYHHTFEPIFNVSPTVCFQSLDKIWIAHKNKILRSIDSGATFNLYQEIPTARYSQNLQFYNNVGFLGTDSCRIYRFVDTVTSISQNNQPLDISVFPNPGNKELRIQGLKVLPHTISITSLTGQTVLKISSFDFDSNGGNIRIPTNNITDGIYILTVLAANHSFTYKIIVSH
jgi:hypothetical protein